IDSGDTYLPVAIHRLTFNRRPNGPIVCHARLRGPMNGQVLEADLDFLDSSGQRLVCLERLSSRRASRETLLRSLPAPLGELFHELVWREQPLPLSMPSRSGRRWLVFADAGGVGEALVRELEAHGSECVVARSARRYEQTGATQVRLNPAVPEDFHRAL